MSAQAPCGKNETRRESPYTDIEDSRRELCFYLTVVVSPTALFRYLSDNLLRSIVIVVAICPCFHGLSNFEVNLVLMIDMVLCCTEEMSENL